MGDHPPASEQDRTPWANFFHHLRLWLVVAATIAVPIILLYTRDDLKTISENAITTAEILKDHAPIFVGPREGVVKVTAIGESTVDFADYFVDDGSFTLYAASVTPGKLLVKIVNGTEVTLIGLAEGAAYLQLTAIDERGGSADQQIKVTVEADD